MTKTLSRGIVAALCIAMAATIALVAPKAASAASTDGTQLATGSIVAEVQAAVATPAKYGNVTTAVKSKSGHILLNKTYIIALASDSSQLSKLVGAKGTAVKAVKESNKKTVKWKIEYSRGKKAYTIKNASTGEELSVKGKVKDGARVASGGSTCYWTVTQTKKGYKISPKSNKKLVLTVKGSNFVLKSSNGSTQQRFWLFDPSNWKAKNVLKNGTYTLSPVSSAANLLTIPGNTTKNNVKATIAANKASANQMFEITSVGNGRYKIVNVATGKALTASGTKVVQSGYSKSNKAQQWKASVSPEGQIVFVNRKTGKMLDGSGTTATLTDAVVATAATGTTTTTAGQRWAVTPTVTTMSLIEQKALSYANKYGARVKDKEKKGSKTVSKKMYYLSIDMSTHTLVIFKRATKNSTWEINKVFTVSTGRGNNTAVANRLSTGKKKYTNDAYEDGYSAYYWTGINYGSWTHSVICHPGTHSVRDGRLGYSISMGCIRNSFTNAKWIYDNVNGKQGVSTYY